MLRVSALLALLTISCSKELWEYDRDFPAELPESKLKSTHYKDHQLMLNEDTLEEALDTFDFLMVVFKSDTVDGESIMNFYSVNKGQFAVFTKETPDAAELSFAHYRGNPHTPEGIAQFVRRSLAPTVCERVADKAAAAAFVAKHAGSARVVAAYQPDTSLNHPMDAATFYAHVEEQLIMAPDVPCAVTDDDDAADAYGGGDGPSLVLLKDAGGTGKKERVAMPVVQLLDGIGPEQTMKLHQIAHFVHRHARKPVLTLKQEDAYEVYWNRGAAHLMMFGTEKELPVFTAVAEKLLEGPEYRSVVPIFVDMSDGASEAEAFQRFWVLPRDCKPAAVRLYLRRGRGEYIHFSMGSGGKGSGYSEASVLAFARQFVAGNLLPSATPKPSAPPVEGWGGEGKKVKVVARYDYEAFTKQPKTDVLLMFYSPVCNYCKKFIPHLEKFAEGMSGAISVGGFDLTKNSAEGIDRALGVRGVPTLVLFPAYHKEAPVKWNARGEKDLDSLVEWLDEAADAEFTFGGESYGKNAADPEGYKAEISDDEFDEL